jgi:hypothetical protein
MGIHSGKGQTRQVGHHELCSLFEVKNFFDLLIRLSSRSKRRPHIPGLLPSRWGDPSQPTGYCCIVPWTQNASQKKPQPIGASALPSTDNTWQSSTSPTRTDGCHRPRWQFLQWRRRRFPTELCTSVIPAQPASFSRFVALPRFALPPPRSARVCRPPKPGGKENRWWGSGLPLDSDHRL